jgi:hypothetical protein
LWLTQVALLTSFDFVVGGGRVNLFQQLQKLQLVVLALETFDG